MARVKRYHTALQFDREFTRDIRGSVEAAMTTLHREAHKEGKRLLEKHTPSGETGGLKRSLVSLVAGVRADPDVAITRPGQSSAIASTDKAWHAINWGRRRQFYRKGGFSRLGGSPLAPRGMTKPAAEELQSMVGELQARAVAAGEAAIK